MLTMLQRACALARVAAHLPATPPAASILMAPTAVPSWPRAVHARARSTPAAAASGEEDAVVYNVLDNGVATITLNDARRRNPLSHAVLQRLSDLIAEVC